MTATDADGYLATYLRDHHAGASAGLELARRLDRQNASEPYAETLTKVAATIASDRRELEHVMGLLGVSANPVKEALARVGEMVSRLKANRHLLSYSPLSRLIELETLSLGIRGKRALWVSLRTAPRSELADVDLDALIASADAQYEQIEELRVRAASEALARSSDARHQPAVIDP